MSQPVTRRSLLKRGLIGGALLAVGGSSLLAFRRSAVVALPAEGLLATTPREFAVLSALAKHFVPDRTGFPSSDAVRLAFKADRILSQVDPSALNEMKQLLMLFENGLANFVFGLRTHPFTQLPFEEQAIVLNEWAHSSVVLRRSGYLALRATMMGGYYADPVTWPAVGYGGPPTGIHDPNAPVWKGGGQERPPSLGRVTESP